jgi:hypothetical protein
MIDRRHILFAGLGSFVVPAFLIDASAQGARPSPVAATSQAEAAGNVAAVKGDVTARAAGQTRQLQNGQQVYVRERVQTAAQSRLHAALGPATNLYMGENTRIMIDRHLVKRGGTIHLAAGAVLFDRKDPDPKPAVTIRSPYAMLAVRGTKVFAGPSNGVFGVFVEEGLVVVRNANGVVTLRPGEGTNIAKPGARPTPAAQWGRARIEAALRSVQ